MDIFNGFPGGICSVYWRYFIGVLKIFDQCSGDILVGVVEIFDGHPGDIWSVSWRYSWVSWRYFIGALEIYGVCYRNLMDVLEIFEGCLGDI